MDLGVNGKGSVIQESIPPTIYHFPIVVDENEIIFGDEREMKA
jgi:hypothetical protein